MSEGSLVVQPKKKLGRPTKLTPETQARICDALRAGNYLETTAAYAGIDRTTLFDWLRRGRREPSGIYHDFVRAVDKAMADAEIRDVSLIAKAAAAGVWQASAWRLERKYPDRWGRFDRHRVEAAVLSVQVDANDAVEELTRLLTSHLAARGTDADP